MNFSLILPSRERPSLLLDLLRSIEATAAEPDKLEAFIALDKDDESADELDLSAFPFCRAYVLPRQPGTTSYFNFLAAQANGDYIWALNDDCVLTTKGWDAKALDFMKRPHVGFGTAYLPGSWPFYGRTHDNLGQEFSMFPMLSRAAYEAQGFFFPPEFPGWAADNTLYGIWQELGRVVDLPMVTVEHRSHHHGNRERDAVSEHVGNISKCSANSPDVVRKYVPLIRDRRI